MIGLSELEFQIINKSRVFKRLRDVKQLGLAHYVFPSANYSRFSHSIGVCHVVGRILGSLRRAGVEIEDREVQLYRLAGLFHDLGHYPFSHTMEVALKDAWGDRVITEKKSAKSTAKTKRKNENLEEPPFEHEPLGLKVLEKDLELNEIFGQHGRDITIEDVRAVLAKEDPRAMRFISLISSDLDADRIDYLLRNTHHAGLPYGSIDVNHLLSEMRLDQRGRICLTAKALKTADHFFLGRYFDYQQVPYNKTVKASELVLQDVIAELLRLRMIAVSRNEIIKKIEGSSWCDFDDAYIIQQIRALAGSNKTTEIMRMKAKAILYRQPPKLVGEVEYIDHLAEDEVRSRADFNRLHKDVSRRVSTWATTFNLDPELWYVWTMPGQRLTKIGSVRLLGNEQEDQPEAQGGAELARILVGNESKPIVNIKSSIMHVMSNYALYVLRLYVLFPGSDESRRHEIAERVATDINDPDWKGLIAGSQHTPPPSEKSERAIKTKTRRRPSKKKRA